MADDPDKDAPPAGGTEDKPAEPYLSFDDKAAYTAHMAQTIGKKTAGHKRKEETLQAQIDALQAQVDEGENTDTTKTEHDKAKAKWERQQQELATQKAAAQDDAAEARAELRQHRRRDRARELLTGAKVKSEHMELATKLLLLEDGLFEVQQQEDGTDIVAVVDRKTGLPAVKPDEMIAEWVNGTPFGQQAPRGSPAPGAGPSKPGSTPGSRPWGEMTAQERVTSLRSQGK